MITMYGISQCDTIKKARRWLDENSINYHFHDYRKESLTQEQLSQWSETLGWEALLNRRGTTWRKLPETIKSTIDQASAISLMLDNPVIIKRPLLIVNQQMTLGFQPDQWQKMLIQ
ncbi:MAG: ArsC family reductase [Endozoicomonadaceae bacterium]|nr:ArsC family reductase [Endozoicomonadaceae bacterium]